MQNDNNLDKWSEKEVELQEWRDSIDYLIQNGGMKRVSEVMAELQKRVFSAGIKLPFTANTPYINTIPVSEQPTYPGSRELERRIKSMIRWNAMAMVVRANRIENGIGGHISTYASAATLYEVGFNHFFRAPKEGFSGDQVYFQGHASPGIYARAFLEGRFSVDELKNFRHEVHAGGGLPSYPHPWLRPDFWQFPTVSMGLGPIMAIYQARFNRYLEDRGLKEPAGEKVWAFLGDGETDEPEALGAISLAARENLDNLIFVINCNLQRLDGPVRGNGKIIQELERNFRGAGWNVIKVIWGSDWDELLARDKSGLLVKRMGEVVDGEYQNYIVRGGAHLRKHFYGKYPELLKLVEHLSDEQLERLRLGGHDPQKVYAAYHSAVNHKGAPTVILARTVKGYGLGEAGEGKNITHSQKKMNELELRTFRSRFGIPISDEKIDSVPFYRSADDSQEIIYLQEQRKKLNGYMPIRREESYPIRVTPKLYDEFLTGTEDREVSTTMVFVRLLSKLLSDKEVGKLIVPIVPDEARTFGMESLFRKVGIYSHVGQLYEPVDRENLLYYKEAKDGQIFEEGITEAGSLASFIAAGTAYSTHNINTIPFYIFYSMFGLQRTGDLVWAGSDMRMRGFLIGGTAGRTTLAGEGLQHQDGNSHLFAYPYPTMKAYDPAFAYELAIIIREGIERMYGNQESLFYYLTVMNENYPQPPIPKGKKVEEGILKGIYQFNKSKLKDSDLQVQLLGSGAILTKVLQAQELLQEKYNVAADVWSVTSYKELHNDAVAVERWNMFNPDKKQKVPFVTTALKDAKGGFVAASDYVRALPESISKWIPGPLLSLGTDGFGRSDGRRHLRDFFEIDPNYIALGALTMLMREGKIESKIVTKAMKDLGINPEKLNPLEV
ncbi:MAG: pyruvate dehydrogenase (acetyl-transferring), homodimeric type [Deferribacteres bacterium]|nr:pyruvate dehydrogenase (acetyl-transferring), homodimeric type [candidate division KSB1 bacterium]MCB9500904.1 pyruvate dehydrogenase (acetyl-transferring), homodimeric type [Deferribacteres bacterium]